MIEITHQKEYKVMVVVLEVDDEEGSGVLVELMTLVVPMEMKEEEDDFGDL